MKLEYKLISTKESPLLLIVDDDKCYFSDRRIKVTERLERLIPFILKNDMQYCTYDKIFEWEKKERVGNFKHFESYNSFEDCCDSEKGRWQDQFPALRRSINKYCEGYDIPFYHCDQNVGYSILAKIYKVDGELVPDGTNPFPDPAVGDGFNDVSDQISGALSEKESEGSRYVPAETGNENHEESNPDSERPGEVKQKGEDLSDLKPGKKNKTKKKRRVENEQANEVLSGQKPRKKKTKEKTEIIMGVHDLIILIVISAVSIPIIVGLCFGLNSSYKEAQAAAESVLFPDDSETDSEEIKPGYDLDEEMSSFVNKEQDLKELKEKAQTGDPESQYFLGTLYYSGNHVDQDRETGVAWIRRAAGQGYEPAIKYLTDREIPLN